MVNTENRAKTALGIPLRWADLIIDATFSDEKSGKAVLNAHSVVPIQLGPTGPQVPLEIIENDRCQCRRERRVWPVAPTSGIGTTSPSQMLQIGNYNTTTQDSKIRVASGNGSQYMGWDLGTQYGGTNTASPNYGFTIGNTNGLGTSSTTRLFIDYNSGNVGIGTTSAAAALDVAGNIRLSGSIVQTLPMIYSTSVSSIGGSASTWTSMSSLVTYSDNIASGVSRSASVFTFPTAGIYTVQAFYDACNANASYGMYLGLRMRRTNGTAATLAQQTTYVGAGVASCGMAQLNAPIQVNANDTVDLQYMLVPNGGAAGIQWNASAMNGETSVTSAAYIYKIQ